MQVENKGNVPTGVGGKRGMEFELNFVRRSKHTQKKTDQYFCM